MAHAATKSDSASLFPSAPAGRRSQLGGRTALGASFSAPPTRDELRPVCQGLLAALKEECVAAGAEVAHLGEGTRLSVVGSGSVYRFNVSGPLDASDGDPILFRTEDREVEGAFLSCEDRVVQLTLVDDLGAYVPAGGELLLDAPWMIARLRERVREAFEIGVETPRLFNLPNALRTLGIGEITVASAGLTPDFENDRRPLNEAQEHALGIALRSPLSIIASPAGTGKTLTFGALIEACYRAGLRTLVAAPSNVALDLVLLQACERLEGDEEFTKAAVLRLGSEAGDSLRTAYGSQVILDDVIARLRPKLQARLAKAQADVDAAAAALTQRRATSPCDDAEIRLRREALSSARAHLREVRREARDYGRSLTGSARVVGATLARVFLDPTLGGFDVVIIDEASMAHGPAVFLAAGLARRHVVIGGDPFQLAAPVRSKGPHRHWLAEDVFQRLDVLNSIRHDEFVPYLTQLTEQRRSAPDICGLLGSVWYGPSLQTAPEVIRRERARTNLLFGTAALCFIDTSSLGAKAYHPWGRTFANDQHASLIADLVAYLGSAGELPDVAPDGSEVLIMSHYRGQVAAIRRHLGAEFRGRGVGVRTVHRAQGAEASTSIFDLTLTRNLRTSVSSVMTATRPEHEGSRLLAVAASRARSRLIVLGDMEWVERSVATESVLGRLCAHLMEYGQEIPVGELRRPPRITPRLVPR